MLELAGCEVARCAIAVGGDALVETTVAMPAQCFAPLVFVTSPGGAWFAVAGL